MTDLEALARRCEAATEGSRELDVRVYHAISPKLGFTWEEFSGGMVFNKVIWCPHYSTSIDAALTLVPAGCAWALYSDGPTYRASAEIGPHPIGGELMVAKWTADGETPALALAACALKARAHAKEG